MTTDQRNAAMDRLEYLDEQISELHVDAWFAADCGDERSARRASHRIARLRAERRHWLMKFPEVRYARKEQPTS